MKKYIAIFMAAIMLLPGCSSWNKMANGTALGAGAGAAIGAGIGALIGHDAKGAALGAAIGTAVGAGTGAAIGKKMDKKAEELAKLENAKIEEVKDQNNLTALKVTFDSGILFPLNGTTLSESSKSELKDFAAKMSDMTDTDITIYGHTDNTGSAEVNERISGQRAAAVESYLNKCGIAMNRMATKGMSYNDPVASNETAEGRAQNRRVEIYITANEKMISDAQNGSLE